MCSVARVLQGLATHVERLTLSRLLAARFHADGNEVVAGETSLWDAATEVGTMLLVPQRVLRFIAGVARAAANVVFGSCYAFAEVPAMGLAHAVTAGS